MSDRYLDAKALALEALALSVDGRAAFLERRCGDDETLRAEALWLMQAAETVASDRLPEDWVSTPAASAPSQATLAAGERITAAAPGSYRMLSRLGEGGMGVVWLAEREEGDARQTVAVKFLGQAMSADSRHARRFAEEHRILATLRHPNIARLLEGGVTDDGRPFIAMEYVDGMHIDRWCARHAYTLRERLTLFLKVCAAVEHAHRHLVIHRDLKPANILVAANGEPKLLDFGIARLLDDSRDPEAPTRTQTLTPAYASPEQIEGQALTTATDIWALGVVLYELLTGQRPHRALEGHRLGEAILSGEVEAPSRRLRRSAAQERGVGPATTAVAGRIPADIDAIVLKALRADPAARYASVAELAADIGRFQQSRPVLARRGRMLYRLGRFARRQRWAIAAGLAAVAVAAGFVVQRESQLEQVMVERNKAQAISEFMRELFAKARPAAGQDGERVMVREVLDQGASDLDRREDLDATTRTALRLAIAGAYDSLGLERRSLPLLEASLADLQRRGGDAVLKAEILLGIATAYSIAGDNAKALDAARNGIARVVGNESAFATWADLRRSELSNLSLMAEAPPEAIIAGFRGLLAELATRQGPDRDDRIDRLTAAAWSGLSEAYGRLSNTDEAIEAAARAMELGRRSNSAPAVTLQYEQRHATLILGKDPAEGVKLLQEVDRRYVGLIGENTGARAVLLNQISVGLSQLDRDAEALDWGGRAVEVARSSLGTENRIYLQLAVNHAMSLNRSSRRQEALATVEQALPGLRQLLAPGIDAVNLAFALSTRARILLDTDAMTHAATALSELEEAHALLTPNASEFLVVQNGITHGLVRAHMALRQRDRAQASLRTFVALLDAHGIPAGSHWHAEAEKTRALIGAP